MLLAALPLAHRPVREPVSRLGAVAPAAVAQ
jgi:hypothetical protein